MKRMIYYTSTEKNAAVMAIESGAMLSNTYNIVIFAKQWLTPLNVMGVKKLTADYGRYDTITRKILTYK